MAGSIDFNGTTSKLENTTADVLNSLSAITVCAWVNADGAGESNGGRVFSLPEGEGTSLFSILHNASASVLTITKGAGGVGTTGVWTIPVTDAQWNAVAVRLDFSGDNAPTARVNFALATVTQSTAPVGIQDAPATGYCIGNRTTADRTWDGKIARFQLFNAILSDADADAALRVPGSITSGLRLYLPMTADTDINDASGLGFNGTGTALATGADGPTLFQSAWARGSNQLIGAA